MFAIKTPPKRIAIVVGGGPAPGINSVIAAAAHVSVDELRAHLG